MKAALVCLSLGFLAIAACSSSSGDPSGGTGGNHSGHGGSTSAAQTSSGSGAGGGSVPAVPFCRQFCNSAAECAIPNVPAYDASHYACNDSVCAYTGCQSDNECSMVMAKPSVCKLLNGATIATCYPKCDKAADCAIPNVPAYDASHYACTDGACEYTGCQSDMECSTTLQKMAMCKALNGAKYPGCYATCTMPAECATPNVPSYDESHYKCNDGLCAYQGCQSNDECSMVLQKMAVCK